MVKVGLWKKIIAVVLTVIAGGYGINVVIDKPESIPPGNLETDCILLFDNVYEMEDGSTIVVNISPLRVKRVIHSPSL